MALFPISLFGAQKHNEVDFNFPADVSKTALADLNKALKSGDGCMVVDAIVRHSIAQSDISPDNFPAIVSRIDSTLQLERRAQYRSLLYYFEATLFEAYSNRYVARRHLDTVNDAISPGDYTEWDDTMFQNKINELVAKALEQPEQLRNHPIGEFKGLIRCDDRGTMFVPTLYQFMCMKCCELLEDSETIDHIIADWKQSVEGNVPAYIFASLRNGDQADELYERFKDNEHCGLALSDMYSDSDLYHDLKAYAAKFPNSIYTPTILNRITELEQREASASYPQALHSGDSFQVDVSSRNVNRVKLTVYRVPDKWMHDKSYNNVGIDQLTPVREQVVDIQGTIPFRASRIKTRFDPLPYGLYVITPSYSVNGETIENATIHSHQFLRVSDMAMFSVSEPDSTDRIFAVDHKTGAPLLGVKISGRKLSGTTDPNGCISVPDNVQSDQVYADKNKDRYGDSFYYSRFSRNSWSRLNATLYTDLGIYRPGETVKLASILYFLDYKTRTVMPNELMRLTLFDTNRQPVDTATCTTDEFGRIECSFNLPTDRMNGQWQIVAETGINFRKVAATKYINVSEYKTPTFEVTFPEAKYSFVNKQPVKLEGKAETYSGMPVANAEVKLTLCQSSWSWWWRGYDRSSEGTVLSDTTVTTDAEGKFAIEFPDSLFTECITKRRWARYNYTLQAQVTDGAGETQEATHSFIIGTRRGIALRSDDMTHVNDKPVTLPLTYNTTDENQTAVACTWELSTVAKRTVVATGNLMSDRPTIDLTKVPSGRYNLKIHILGAEDDEDDVNAEMELTLYRKSDKRAPVDDCTLWMHPAANTVDKHNKGHILVGTSAPEAHIYYTAADRNGVVSEGWLHYSPGLHDLVLDVPTDRDNYLSVELVSYHNGEYTQKSTRLVAPAATREVHLRATSFRDRLVPGHTEHWTLQFTDKDGAPHRGALLLAMTDKAINTLSPNTWSFTPPRQNPTWSRMSMTHLAGSSHLYSSWMGRRIDEIAWQLPELYTYDQEPFSMPGRGIVMYKTSMLGVAANSVAAAEEDALYESAIEDRNVTRSLWAEVVVEDEVKSEDLPADGADAGSLKRLDDIKLREADVKTALWMPMLTTDRDGNVAIEFEAPEFNTTWIMQAIGYDTDLLSDRLEREVITQKPIMVKSSLPRFVRQGDHVTLSANLQNATDNATTVDAVIELFDPRSGDIFASRSYRHDLTAHGSQAVSIEWDVPADAPFVGFRVKAANEQFGDGEQVLVPVLQAIQPVIEAKPFYIEAGTSSFTQQIPQSARDARVTLEYCDNPVWYCVTALPTIHDESCVTASSLAHSLFAIEVAQGVAQSQPQVREAINYWKNNEQDSTLVSMLAKNQDLKIGTLLASPWLREADRQTLRMSRLHELMDTQLMETERKRIIAMLGELQMSDGGFTWLHYPGCRSSYYTTNEVLQLMGEIQHLGYMKDNSTLNDMMKRALNYYDNETLRIYKERNNKKDYSGFSHFVYVRTLFPEVPMSGEVKSLFNNILKQMSKNWSKGLSLGEKAYYALSLNRNGYEKTARDITESIRQFSITKPELGTYWDNLQVGWRYFDKVAVTSTILQALNECDRRQDEIDRVRKWILLMKQTNDWGNSSLAADAVYSLLTTGSKWLERNAPARITIDGEPMVIDKMDEYLGYFRKDITVQPGSVINIERNGNSPAWGAVYSQFQAPMTDIEQVSIDELSISKEYMIVGTDGKLTPATQLHVGDRVRVRTVIKCNRDLDFVTVIDERASCFEPVDKLSGYRHADQTWYYHETKDAQTRLFFCDLQKGTHIISYDAYVTMAGTFSAGIASAQCQYAPQIAAHSAGMSLHVE